jgi:hypothetical protein
MKYAAEMDSGAMIYRKYQFHKDCFSHSKGYGSGTQTDRYHGDRISLLTFVQSEGSRLIFEAYTYE